MSTVMEAWTFQMLSDMYDQIPFDEAFKGDKGLLNPHYRNGQDIYDSLIARLDYALGLNLDQKTSINPSTNDFVFGGNMESWKQFANTVKLKIYLRQCFARPDVAEKGIRFLMDAPMNKFLTSDAAMTQFTDEPGKDNPLYGTDRRNLNTTNNICGSSTLIDYLISNNDSRAEMLFAQNSGGSIVGRIQGDWSETSPPGTYSLANIGATDPVYFICAAESYFLQAEARVRYYGGSGAKELYDLGVLSAFERLGLDGSNYIGSGNVYEFKNSFSSEEMIEIIMLQKWIALTGIEGMEMWIERNRNLYPKFETETHSSNISLMIPIGASTNEYPKRLPFLKYESDNNTNAPSYVETQVPTWWNKKTF